MREKFYIVWVVIALTAIFMMSSIASAAPTVQQPTVRSVWELAPKDTVGQFTTTASATSLRAQFADENVAYAQWVWWLNIVVTDDAGKTFRVVSVPIDQPGYQSGFEVQCDPVMALCTVTTVATIVGNADNPGNTVRRVRYTLRGQGVPVGIQLYSTSLTGKEALSAKAATSKMMNSSSNKVDAEAAYAAFSSEFGDVIPFAVIGSGKRGCDFKSVPAQDGTCVVAR